MRFYVNKFSLLLPLEASTLVSHKMVFPHDVARIPLSIMISLHGWL